MGRTTCLCQSANLLAMTGSKRHREVVKTAIDGSELEEGEVPAQEGEVRPEPGNVQMPGWPQVRTLSSRACCLPWGYSCNSCMMRQSAAAFGALHVNEFCAVKSPPCHMEPMPVPSATRLQLTPDKAAGSSSTPDYWLHPKHPEGCLACRAEPPPGAATSA